MAPPLCHLPRHKYQTRKLPCFYCSKYTSEKREATLNFAGWQMGIMSCRNYVWLSDSKLHGVIIWFLLLTDPRMMMYLFYKGKESIKCLQVISLLVLYFKYFHNIIHMLNNVTIYIVKASGRDFYVHIKPRKVSLSWNNVKITHLTVTPPGLIFVTFITGVEWAGSIHMWFVQKVSGLTTVREVDKAYGVLTLTVFNIVHLRSYTLRPTFLPRIQYLLPTFFSKLFSICCWLIIAPICFSHNSWQSSGSWQVYGRMKPMW